MHNIKAFKPEALGVKSQVMIKYIISCLTERYGYPHVVGYI